MIRMGCNSLSLKAEPGLWISGPATPSYGMRPRWRWVELRRVTLSTLVPGLLLKTKKGLRSVPYLLYQLTVKTRFIFKLYLNILHKYLQTNKNILQLYKCIKSVIQ